MHRLAVGVTVAAVAMSIAACGGGKGSGPAASTTSTTTTTSATSSKPPIAQAALANLLLTPAEIDGLLGVTGTTSKEKIDKLQDDTTGTPGPPGWKFPDECLYAKGPVVAPVYAGSGNTAVSGDMDTTNLNNDQDIMMGQALVLFPSAKEANDFFTTSAQRWPACADRQFAEPTTPDGTQTTYQVGPFANANGILSVTLTTTMSMGGQPNPMVLTAQRALTVRNNAVVDVVLMRKDPADFGVKVAAAISGKIDKQQ
jgi:PknH-like extracellular domain